MTGTVLIVDDEPDNIGVLYNLLESAGSYRLLVATDGESVFKILEDQPVDLLLLDIMMPGMDGYQVCGQLKKMDQFKNIPVLFLTALSDRESKLKGFDAGAVDYITKPFEQEEVLARVRTHMDLYLTRKSLEEQNERINTFAHTVAHDLKNPLWAILMGLEDLEESLIGSSGGEFNDLIKQIKRTAWKSSDIVEALLLLAGTSRHSSLIMNPIEMNYIMENVLSQLKPVTRTTGGTIHTPEKPWPDVMGYSQWVEQIWINLITNGLKFGGESPEITLDYYEKDDMVFFTVQDNGPGLSQKEMEPLFKEITGSEDSIRLGQGLGLLVVKRIIDKLGGTVGIESEKGKGSTFYFSLKKTEPVDFVVE